MKQLQCNFTTPEQSKRLLELGVPADSADCFYTNKSFSNKCIREWDNEIKHNFFEIEEERTPCWSVGRLIEIMNICSIHNIVSIYRTDRDVTQIDIIIETIINRINGNSIDFSKLEE